MTYYEAHNAERLEYQREYNKKNREKYLEYQRQYYILNHVPKPRQPRPKKPRIKKPRTKKQSKPPILKALPIAPSILYEKRINKTYIVPQPSVEALHVSFL